MKSTKKSKPWVFWLVVVAAFEALRMPFEGGQVRSVDLVVAVACLLIAFAVRDHRARTFEKLIFSALSEGPLYWLEFCSKHGISHFDSLVVLHKWMKREWIIHCQIPEGHDPARSPGMWLSLTPKGTQELPKKLGLKT